MRANLKLVESQPREPFPISELDPQNRKRRVRYESKKSSLLINRHQKFKLEVIKAS